MSSSIRINFVGLISQIREGADWEDFPGLPFTGYFVFDSSAPDLHDTGPNADFQGIYESAGPIFGMAITARGATYTQFGYLKIEASRFFPPAADQSSYTATAINTSAIDEFTIRFGLQTNNQNRGLPDDSLPLSPVDATLFETSHFNLLGRRDSFEIIGKVTGFSAHS
jgi:hypothetical protein